MLITSFLHLALNLPLFFIHRALDDFDIAILSSAQDACHGTNLVYGPAGHEAFAAQWLEHLTGVQKVICSTPVVDWDFFFVPSSRMTCWSRYFSWTLLWSVMSPRETSCSLAHTFPDYTRTTGRERTPGDLAGVSRDKTPLNLHFFSLITTGGVRGVGFIHSPLFTYGPRTAMELMHVTDWLPTLYFAAGGNVSDLQNIDGVNMWDTLTQATESPRQYILHNIDPFSGAAAIRYRNWKLLVNICEQTENYIYNIF